jgi:hypothetical protein
VLTRLIALALTGAILPASSAIAAAPVRPGAAPASFGIQLLSTAAETLQNPLARTYIADGLAPGTGLTRTVEISNTTGSTAVVSVYPAAATLDNSSFAFAPGQSQNELSRSTTVSHSVLLVPAHGDALDTVTITIPKQASEGEQYGVVWAQMSTPAQARGGVTLVNRVGIRMYVSIGRGGLPAAHFQIGSLNGQRAASGQPLVRATIHNNGQRTLAISGDLILANGPGGLTAGPFPVKLAAALAPGDSEVVTATLDRILPRGPWHAQIRLASGPLQESAEATISFPVGR